jgi:hypothetical protein
MLNAGLQTAFSAVRMLSRLSLHSIKGNADESAPPERYSKFPSLELTADESKFPAKSGQHGQVT